MTKYAIGSLVMTLAIMSFTTFAAAQRVDANGIHRRAQNSYERWRSYAFPAPPEGFNPLTATTPNYSPTVCQSGPIRRPMRGAMPFGNGRCWR